MSLEFNIQNETASGGRRAQLVLPHQTVETPVFMPVGTLGTVKAVPQETLESLGAQIILGNTYLLHGFFRMDAYGSHDFGKRFQVFVAGENLLNRQIEVGKTPTTTLGSPRVGRAGINIRLGAEGR